MVARQDKDGLFMLCAAKGHKGGSVYLQGLEQICKPCQIGNLKEKNKALREGLEFINEQLKPEEGEDVYICGETEMDERIDAIRSRIKKALNPTNQKKGD